MMKAAVIETPGVLNVREVPEPVVGEYDALCEILYGAVCTGTDRHIMDGVFPYPVNYPTILGHESIGRVIELGSKVRNYRVGDLVTRVGAIAPKGSGLSVNWGGFAERGVARDHRAMKEDGIDRGEWAAFRVNQVLPGDFDPAASTMIITWRETLSYITRMGVKPGARVLVFGSGGTGLSFVNHAANLMAGAVVLIGGRRRLELGRTLGATGCFAYDDPDLPGAIRKSDERGYDVIVDAVGKTGQVDRVLSLLAPGGMVGIYGIDDYPNVAVSPFLAKGTFTVFKGGYDEEESHAAVVRHVQEGRLIAEHYYDPARPFTLEMIAEAFRALRNREMVKALIKIKTG